MSDLLHIAADSLPIWRDGLVALLASLVIACLWLYATLVGAE